MPELPEVETIVRDLRIELLGERIVGCVVVRPSMVRWPDAETFAEVVVGRRIERIERRGKYIRVGLEGERWLIIHLGMSGVLSLVEKSAPVVKHTHVIFNLEDGRELRYSDPRRFGRLGAGFEAELQAAGVQSELGPEANGLGFDLYERLRGRRVALKTALLNQRILAGVGNIYADEALWRARLRPERSAGGLSRRGAQRLQQALREVLLEAIENRGSTIEGYRDAWGQKGRQQEQLAVYGRAGEPCLRCGWSLSSKRIGGRSSVWCARCQA